MCWNKTVLATAAALSWCVSSWAADNPPVLAYAFHPGPIGVIQDLSGAGHHAVLRGTQQHVESPVGPALVFDGAVSVVARHSDKLVMTRELTLDLWLRADTFEGVQCVLDKAGERYRLALSSNGAVHFGLKSAAGRADLYGGKLEAGRWHRVTCVFQRPEMTLYVDGQRVAAGKFDDQPDRGGELILGAKGGGHDFFRGALALVRIYDRARPPRPGDETLDFGDTVRVAPKLEVRESPEAVEVDTGAMQFVLDPRRGAISRLSAGGKELVAGGDAAPVFATVMESNTYDGVTDAALRRFLPGVFSFEGLKTAVTDQTFTAAGKGSLVFPGGDALDCELEYEAAKGSSRLRVSVSFQQRGEFHNRFLREVGLRQPLALDNRKRVVQAGDQGLRWDTRHLFQFHMHIEPMNPPDYNVWRHFYVDQDTDHSYRIWRAESSDTAGLHTFAGRRAAGWMTLYDQHGGALFGYRGLGQRAPKLLYANADGGGEGTVFFYGPTQPALDLADPRLGAAVFGQPHEVDWIFFAGEEAFVQPDRILAAAWGEEQLPSDGPTRFRPVADEVDLWNAAPAAGDASPFVIGGLPVPRGAVRQPDQARLFVRGKEAPCQIEPLAYWPDGSLKWLLLIFPLDGDGGIRFAPGRGEGDEAAFRVTLRTGEDVACVLRFGSVVRAGAIEDRLSVAARDGGAVVDTGPLQFALSLGSRWASSALLNGREMLAADGQAQAFVDFVRPETYTVGTTHPAGTLDPGPVRIEKLEIEEAGPLRAVIRLEGTALCEEPPRVILRLEFYRGRSFARLFHSVEFLHKDPRAAFVRRMGLRLPLALDASAARFAAGGQNGPVALPNAPLVGLRQTSHVNYEAWNAPPGGKHRQIVDSAHASRGWLDVADDQAGLAVVQRCMWQEAPKELLFRRDGSAFEIGLWPESSPLMDVRRYSNYPHRAQGESVPMNPRWVLDDYYRNDPFVGVTRTHETLLYFHGPAVTPDEVDAVAADFQSQPLVYAGWPWYARTGVTYPQPDPDADEFRRFNTGLEHAADWWLFHQRAQGWYGIWDFGDVGHRFRSGYGRIFPPETLAELLKLPRQEMIQKSLSGLPQRQDYFPQNDWAFDNGRWGWGNTEGLVNHFISQQYLRTGRRELFFFLEACARHSRDVDARHAGRWFGRGTRHGVQHWSDGNHEERQTTFTEQRFHYLLSGEHRTREWNRNLADNFYLKTECRNHASHSGRSYGLLFRWEITGDPELGELMERYMSIFAQPEGIDVSPVVRFPQAERVGPAREINGGSMFFHTFGAMHALLEYYYLTGDERLRDSLIKMADHALANPHRGDGGAGGMYRKAVAFAARHAPDGTRYRQALENVLGGSMLRYTFQPVPSNPAHWTGPTAFLVGNVSGGLFWLNDAAYVLGTLEAEPELSARQKQELEQPDAREPLREPRIPRESWQTEYDQPPLADYGRDPLNATDEPAKRAR